MKASLLDSLTDQKIDLIHNFSSIYIPVIDNGVGDYQKNHQYQPLTITRHQDKTESHKSTCIKQSSPLAPVVTALSPSKFSPCD